MTVASADPITIRVIRHVCPFCSRGRSKRAATVVHIGRCWLNPGNRTCKTCAHFMPAESEPEVGYHVPEDCAAGLTLTGAVVTGCERWEPEL